MMAELDILNGFVGKIISDCIDISISEIKKADKNRKSKNQTMETRIYQVTVDALNAFPYNKYKKDEKVYDAAECILNELKRENGDYKESVRLGLNMLSAEITGDICEDFLTLLCGEICKEENRDLAIGHIIRQGERINEQQQQMDRHMQEGFGENNQNHEITHRKLDYLIGRQNEKEIRDVKYLVKSPVANRADEYAQKWNTNVFLNDFNEEDENAGINIKLSDIYIGECLPHYIWGLNERSKDTLRDFLAKYVININGKKMLLILGQPGIGKSTLITWMMANIVEKEENILVYQFASDLGSVDWQSNNLLDEIFSTIGLKYNELEGKSLILDGFDEIYVKENRERILHKLNQELEKKNYLEKLSLIITCRENYVDKLKMKGLEYITLQAWDEIQIRSFCETYEEVIISKDSTRISENLQNKINKIIEKKGIMGIPLILYMVLALEVDIERSSSTVDIYDQVFSLRSGGIYDRRYDVEHRINEPAIKESIHHISQRIAFWMFENNAGEATISQEKFEEICDNEVSEYGEKVEDIQSDTLIGNYFASIKHCEGVGTGELQFVHRSIYEYFVVEYFYESICKLESKEEVAGKLGELLKDGRLSEQILEFIKYKFNKMKKCNLPDSIRETFNIMLRDDMIYHAKRKYKNVIEREMRIFSNMLEIVHLWNPILGKLENKIGYYLQYNHLTNLNLNGADLSEANLSGAYLNQANLSGANLIGINLSGANLNGADLSEANLSEANLNEANLIGVDLNQANLSGADLSGANLSGVNLNEADLSGANLIGTNLSEANLIGVYLIGANLRGANLIGVNLSRVDLRGVDLRGVDLRRVDLRGTIFNESQIDMLRGECDLRDSNVFIFETDKVISYKDYCFREQNG